MRQRVHDGFWGRLACLVSLVLLVGLGLAPVGFGASDPATDKRSEASEEAPSAVSTTRVDRLVLAVLPLKNVTPDPDSAWMGEGFAETITTKLSYVHRLQLVERMQVREVLQELNLDKEGPVSERDGMRAGEILKADYVVIGSCQNFQDEIRINARLVQVKTSAVTRDKAITVTGRFAEMFDMQELVARKLAENLEVPVSQDELDRMAIDETQSVVAFQLKQLADAETDQARREKLLHQALEKDPQYGKAHLALGSYCNGRAIFDAYYDACAFEHVDRALKLDPTLLVGYFEMGLIWQRRASLFRERNEMDASAHARDEAADYFEQFLDRAVGNDSKYIAYKSQIATDAIAQLRSR